MRHEPYMSDTVAERLSAVNSARARLACAIGAVESCVGDQLSLVAAVRPECAGLAAQCRDMVDTLQRLACAPDLTASRARSLMRLCAGLVARMALFAETQSTLLDDLARLQQAQGSDDEDGIGGALTLMREALGQLDRAVTPSEIAWPPLIDMAGDVLSANDEDVPLGI